MLNEGNQIDNFISSSGSGTIINYGSGSDFLTSYGSGSGSTGQKVTVPTVPVPVPQRCTEEGVGKEGGRGAGSYDRKNAGSSIDYQYSLSQYYN